MVVVQTYLLLYIWITVTCCFVGMFKSLISVNSARHLFDVAPLRYNVMPWTEVHIRDLLSNMAMVTDRFFHRKLIFH